MTFRSLAQKLLPSTWFSPFENANPSHRRGQVPGARPGDMKRDLSPGVRSELVKRSRYLQKNSGFVRELVGSMAIYSTGDGIKPQAQSDDQEWNRRAEEYFANWAARCEITGRFSFEECQSLVCRGIDVDGEYFIHKTRSRNGRPVLQLIESHRIGDVDDRDDTVDGIVLDRFGAPVAYRLLLDDGAHRDLPAASVLHVFEPEAVSAVRNAATIQHSINHVLDEMELLALEKHAVKDNADIARVLKRQQDTVDEDGDFRVGSGEDLAQSDPRALQRIIGGKLVAIKPGEDMLSFESKRPSPTFTGFLDHLRRDSAMGVLPFDFATGGTQINSAGVRLIIAKADRRFSFRQLILIQRFLRPVWAYVIGDAVANGALENMPGWWKITCTTPRKVTVDTGREAQQNREDVQMGLKTLEHHFAELGLDFEEEMRVRAQNAKRILELAEEYGVPVEMLWRLKTASETA